MNGKNYYPQEAYITTKQENKQDFNKSESKNNQPNFNFQNILGLMNDKSALNGLLANSNPQMSMIMNLLSNNKKKSEVNTSEEIHYTKIDEYYLDKQD